MLQTQRYGIQVSRYTHHKQTNQQTTIPVAAHAPQVIKLLIAFIHMMNIFALINFAACKLKEWVMIDHDCC